MSSLPYTVLLRDSGGYLILDEEGKTVGAYPDAETAARSHAVLLREHERIVAEAEEAKRALSSIARILSGLNAANRPTDDLVLPVVRRVGE